MVPTLPFTGYEVRRTSGGFNASTCFYEVVDARTPTFAISAYRTRAAADAEAARLTSERTLEALSDALDAALRVDENADTRVWIKADNRLLDACINAGMDRETVDHRAWAAEAIASWLSSAPLAEAA